MNTNECITAYKKGYFYKHGNLQSYVYDKKGKLKGIEADIRINSYRSEHIFLALGQYILGWH